MHPWIFLSLRFLCKICWLVFLLSSQLQQIGVAFLLILLLIVLAIGVIHHWASNNFYLTRTQMLFVCFLAFLLGLAAFLVGWFEGENKYHNWPILLPQHPSLGQTLFMTLLHNDNQPVTLNFTFLFRQAFCGSICWLFFISVSSCWTSIDCKFHHINSIQVLIVIFILCFSFYKMDFIFSFILFLSFSAHTCVPAGPSVTTNCSLFTTSTACLCLWCPCRLWKECQVCLSNLCSFLLYSHGFLILLSFIFYYNFLYLY